MYEKVMDGERDGGGCKYFTMDVWTGQAAALIHWKE